MAIRACKEERNQLLQSKEQMKIVKESLNDGYCDVSGQKDLTLAGSCISSQLSAITQSYVPGDMGGVKVFVARGRQSCSRIL